MIKRKRNKIGRCEYVSFQRADGKIEERLMYPLLDENDGVIRYVTIEEGSKIAQEPLYELRHTCYPK